jgi:hypothetical protein
LTPCHVTEINYVDRGVAARTPLQSPIAKKQQQTAKSCVLMNPPEQV